MPIDGRPAPIGGGDPAAFASSLAGLERTPVAETERQDPAVPGNALPDGLSVTAPAPAPTFALGLSVPEGQRLETQADRSDEIGELAVAAASGQPTPELPPIVAPAVIVPPVQPAVGSAPVVSLTAAPPTTSDTAPPPTSVSTPTPAPTRPERPAASVPVVPARRPVSTEPTRVDSIPAPVSSPAPEPVPVATEPPIFGPRMSHPEAPALRMRSRRAEPVASEAITPPVGSGGDADRIPTSVVSAALTSISPRDDSGRIPASTIVTRKSMHEDTLTATASSPRPERFALAPASAPLPAAGPALTTVPSPAPDSAAIVTPPVPSAASGGRARSDGTPAAAAHAMHVASAIVAAPAGPATLHAIEAAPGPEVGGAVADLLAPATPTDAKIEARKTETAAAPSSAPATPIAPAMDRAVQVAAVGPAVRMFAAELHRAARDTRRTAGADVSAAPLIPMIEGALPAAVAAVEAVAAPLDMGRERWPHLMVERIEKLRDAADAADTRIRLVPDALGAIEVTVRRDGDAVNVHFAAEQAATRALLQDAAPRLAEAAEARGLKLGQTAVDGGGADRNGRQHAPDRPLPSSPRPARSAEPAAEDTDHRIA